jgi:head-tail adaptor
MKGQVFLTRRLVLEEAVRLPDGAGGYSESWSELGTVWADMRPTGTRQRVGDAAVLSRVSYRITLRAAPEGSPRRPKVGQRFRDGARRFRIDAVVERPGSVMFVEVWASEEVAS